MSGVACSHGLSDFAPGCLEGDNAAPNAPASDHPHGQEPHLSRPLQTSRPTQPTLPASLVGRSSFLERQRTGAQARASTSLQVLL